MPAARLLCPHSNAVSTRTQPACYHQRTPAAEQGAQVAWWEGNRRKGPPADRREVKGGSKTACKQPGSAKAAKRRASAKEGTRECR